MIVPLCVRHIFHRNISIWNNAISIICFILLLSNTVIANITYFSCDTNEKLLHNVSEAVDSLVYCGPKTFLHLDIELDADKANNWDWNTLNYPIELESSKFCQFRIPISGNVQNV